MCEAIMSISSHNSGIGPEPSPLDAAQLNQIKDSIQVDKETGIGKFTIGEKTFKVRVTSGDGSINAHPMEDVVDKIVDMLSKAGAFSKGEEFSGATITNKYITYKSGEEAVTKTHVESETAEIAKSIFNTGEEKEIDVAHQEAKPIQENQNRPAMTQRAPPSRPAAKPPVSSDQSPTVAKPPPPPPKPTNPPPLHADQENIITKEYEHRPDIENESKPHNQEENIRNDLFKEDEAINELSNIDLSESQEIDLSEKPAQEKQEQSSSIEIPNVPKRIVPKRTAFAPIREEVDGASAKLNFIKGSYERAQAQKAEAKPASKPPTPLPTSSKPIYDDDNPPPLLSDFIKNRQKADNTNVPHPNDNKIVEASHPEKEATVQNDQEAAPPPPPPSPPLSSAPIETPRRPASPAKDLFADIKKGVNLRSSTPPPTENDKENIPPKDDLGGMVRKISGEMGEKLKQPEKPSSAENAQSEDTWET